MPHHGPNTPRHENPTTRVGLLALALAVAFTGCRIPAARFDARECGPVERCRTTTAAKQVVCDSTYHVASHPVQSIWECLYGTGDHVRAVIQGGFCKRIALPLENRFACLCSAKRVADHGHGDVDPFLDSEQSLVPAEIQLYPDGAECLAVLRGLLESARSRIDILMFEWEEDAVGTAIAEALLAKARQGIPVRVMVDGGGNLIFGRPRSACAPELNRLLARMGEHPNLEVVRIRNPFCRFDHRKLVLVDGQAAWTGGRNFVRRVFCDQHDLSFTIRGPLVEQLQEEFNCFWANQGGRLATAAAAEPVACSPNASAHLLRTEPADHEMQWALYRAIDAAKDHIYIENVYFSDSLLIYKLAQARQRGVQVHVILTVRSTNCLFNCSNSMTANRLLAAGVRVYLYPGMTHVKAVSVDGRWAYIGTGNFDPLSLRKNREIGVGICDGAVIAELDSRLFAPDCAPESEMKAPLPVGVGEWWCELFASLCL